MTALEPGVPVRLLHDRVLVRLTPGEGERRTGAGIVIPATAAVGKRLVWGTVAAVGPNARAIEAGDSVLYDPEDKPEVELHGATYVMLRERDVSALAAARVADSATGLYL
ncbi:chaperonin GroES [Motilibacter peucedani]|uniref:10 kDa chaperonin n=1 Tax=Motilibacter peucedani TaxID=598650 RepID=A0A420XNC0_9ACTN|nr:co-chaperone GroES [Motilibacter peucedani]RKS72771.1 chaperonin GroES [Motilibacter peucedani]